MPPAIEAFVKELQDDNERVKREIAGLDMLRERHAAMTRQYNEAMEGMQRLIDDKTFLLEKQRSEIKELIKERDDMIE